MDGLGTRLTKCMSGLSAFSFCKELWPKQNYTFYVSLYGTLGLQSTCSTCASLIVTWLQSLNLWHMKSQRIGQVYHIVLPRKAYYSSQVSRVCVASV